MPYIIFFVGIKLEGKVILQEEILTLSVPFDSLYRDSYINKKSCIMK